MRKFNLDLLRKITYLHFLTDYESNDFIYPPYFIWDEFGGQGKLRNYLRNIKERFSEIDGLNIYIHFPFCQYKCTFCRQFCFASKNPESYDEYLQLLIQELKMWIEAMQLKGRAKIKSIYLGGGTPTNFDLRKFFYALAELIDLEKLEQVNLESTLDSLLDPQKLTFLKELKLNQKTRLLIGVQSFDEKVLKESNRYPYQRRIYRKVMENLTNTKIPAIGFDLMIGLPGQTRESFVRDLKFLIKEGIGVIYLYLYSQNPLTSLGRKKKKIGLKERRTRQEIYDLARKILSTEGYWFNGDGWILDKNDKPLTSKQFYLRKSFRRGKDWLNIPVGPSARGMLPFYNGLGASLQNANDLNVYRQRILNNKFAINKIWKIKDRDYSKRRDLIRVLRHGHFNKEDYIKKYGKDPEKEFPEEFQFLENILTGTGKLKREKNTIIFKENTGGHLILSRVFYSLEVMGKCKRIIEKKYKNLDFDLNFLPYSQHFYEKI